MSSKIVNIIFPILSLCLLNTNCSVQGKIVQNNHNDTFLRTDGVYLKEFGSYQETISANDYQEKVTNKKFGEKYDDFFRQSPLKNDVYSYTPYRILIFCEQGNVYSDNRGYNFNEEKLIRYQKLMKDTVCKYSSGNFHYSIKNNELKLKHTEWRQVTNVTIRETARIVKDTLYYKEENDDWTKKRTEQTYTFIPFNNSIKLEK